MAPAPQPLPAGFTLQPEFLPTGSATDVLERLIADTPWEDHSFQIFGRTVPMPRRIAWYGPHTYRYSGVVHPRRPMPPLLAGLRDTVAAATGHPFNVVLLNLYRDGADSMGWHADDDYPHGGWSGVASLSLGATRRLRLRPRDSGIRQGVDLAHGSLLFMGPGTQQAWQHAVPKTRRACGPRLNLTFRHMVAGPGGATDGAPARSESPAPG